MYTYTSSCTECAQLRLAVSRLGLHIFFSRLWMSKWIKYAFVQSYRVCPVVLPLSSRTAFVRRTVKNDYTSSSTNSPTQKNAGSRLMKMQTRLTFRHKHTLSRVCEVDVEQHLNNTKWWNRRNLTLSVDCLHSGCSLRPTCTASLVNGSLHFFSPKSN